MRGAAGGGGGGALAAAAPAGDGGGGRAAPARRTGAGALGPLRRQRPPAPQVGKNLPSSLALSFLGYSAPHFSSLSLPLLPPLRPRPPSSLPPAWRSDLLAFRGLRGELRRPRKLFFVCRFIDLPDLCSFVPAKKFRPGVRSLDATMFSTHVFFTTRFHTRTRFTFPIPPLPPQIRPPVSPALLDLAVLLPHGGGEGGTCRARWKWNDPVTSPLLDSSFWSCC